MTRNQRHVVRNPDGGWDVKAPGAQRASSHHQTQAEAEARAKEILGNAGGGEAVIHRPTGEIRDSDTSRLVTIRTRRATLSTRAQGQVVRSCISRLAVIKIVSNARPDQVPHISDN
jgi:hypothetical protein